MAKNLGARMRGNCRINQPGWFSLGALALSCGAATAVADPSLQLYLEGSVYDSISETWVIDLTSELSGETFRLWTIGNVDGSGGHGPMEDVHLVVSYEDGATPTISLTPAQTDGFGGWVDPTLPSAPTFLQFVSDGSVPVRSDGSGLPSHGVFGAATDWQEFDLGLYDETTSSTGDVIGSFPLDPDKLGGHINVYEVSVTGDAGSFLHFDLFGTIVSSQHATFAPHSHDAAVIPAPGAALLAAIGFGFVGLLRRRVS